MRVSQPVGSHRDIYRDSFGCDRPDEDDTIQHELDDGKFKRDLFIRTSQQPSMRLKKQKTSDAVEFQNDLGRFRPSEMSKSEVDMTYVDETMGGESVMLPP